MYNAWELQNIIEALENIANNYYADMAIIELEYMTRAYRKSVPDLEEFDEWINKISAIGYADAIKFPETATIIWNTRQHFQEVYERDYSHIGWRDLAN